MKPSILFLLHLPPPVHGSSMVGASIRNSERINKAFDCTYINLLLSRTIGETGHAGWRKALRLPAIFGGLLWQLLFHRPQMVYLALTATGAAFYRDVALVAMLRLLGVKRLYHLHNKGFSAFGKNKFNDRLYRFVFRNSKVMLLSKYLYPDVSAYVKSEDVYICPNGIEDLVCSEKFIVNSEDKNGQSTVEILFLSNLIASKGVYVLLEACKLLDNKGVDFNCNFIGGEGDISGSQLNEKIHLMGLDSKLKYLGKKYGKEKELIFSTADIFAFPTYFETFGIVIIEAMQKLLPVVSTFEGGIPDVVENGVTGYLVPQQNVQALADKLELLIKNPALRQAMGAAGRKKYEQEFTLEIFEKRMVQVLQEIIENS